VAIALFLLNRKERKEREGKEEEKRAIAIF